MNKFKSLVNPLKWSSALLLTVVLAACGSGSGGTNTSGSQSDVVKPRVIVTIPETTDSGPTAGYATNAAITATFSESINPATISTTSFTVVDTTAGGLAVAGTVTYIDSSNTVRFKPDFDFASGDTYTATIAGTGATPITDLAGNALAGNSAALPAASDYIWSFSPGVTNVTLPTVTLASPANGDIDVALNSSINIIFNATMDVTTIGTASFTLEPTASPGAFVTGVVTYDTFNDLATFSPSNYLAANTQYTATVTTAAADLAGNALTAGIVVNPWSFTTGTGLTLASAGTFRIMATSAITSTGDTIINGDVSLDPGTSMTGFPPATVNGSIHNNDTASAQARADLLKAYNDAKDLPPGTTIAADTDLGALYPDGIRAGTYTSASTMLVSTNPVLDAAGNTSAVWVFQIGSSLTTSADVTLLNGAQAKNVFWVPTQDAIIGAGSIFSGNIIAGRNVTAVTGATINGRILAGATTDGTVALQNAVVSACSMKSPTLLICAP